jgi:hypothetical protein
LRDFCVIGCANYWRVTNVLWESEVKEAMQKTQEEDE